MMQTAFIGSAGFWALLAGLGWGLSGWLIRTGFRRHWALRSVWLAGMGGWVFVLVGGGLWIKLAGAGNFFDFWGREVDASLEATRVFYQQLGWAAGEIAPTLKLSRALMVDAVYAWILLSVWLVTLGRIRRRLRHPAEDPAISAGLPPFSFWVFPESVVWVFLAALGWRLLKISPPVWGTVLEINLWVLLSVFYGLRGMAVLWFRFDKSNWPRGLRGLVPLVAVLVPMAGMAVVLVGVLDTWWDFRRIRLNPA